LIGLDTNVLVRYLTQDDAAQARHANALLVEAAADGNRCFVGSVVLCELAWVLRGAYGLDRATIASTLERILATTQFAIDEKDVVRRALQDYRTGKADFADYVIGHRSQEAGCTATATFDRQLRGQTLFRVLGS
jgi:predicted nucleic-acid-binding protein